MIRENDISQQNSLVNKKLLETIKAQDGVLFHLPFHQLRLESAIGENVIELSEILDPPKSGLYRCRVVYDAEGYEVSYHPYSKRSVTKLKLIEDNSIEYAKKYADRSSLNALFAQKEDADDVLIVKDGLVSDTTIANVAFFYKNSWITPKQPLLNGTTRMRLCLEGRIVEEEIYADDIGKFEAMALMNAMIDFDIIRNKKIEEIIC